jgi:integrase
MARRRSTRRGRGEGSVFEQPNGTWRGKVTTGYDEQGKQRFKWVSGKTQAEALAKLAEIKQRLANGTYSDTKLTLKTYLERWLEEKEHTLKPSTLEQYSSCIHRSIVPHVGKVKLDKLTPMQVQTLINGIRDVSGAARAAKCRTVLYSAYKQAIRWQLVTRNPVEATEPVKEPHRETPLWEPEEAARFLDVAREHRMHTLFYLSMATGLRRGELLGLRWVDIEGNLLHVKQTLVKVGSRLVLSTPKTRKGFRTVALSPDVLELLFLHRQRQEAERVALGAEWPETLTVTVQKGDKLENAELPNIFVFTSEVGTLPNPDNLKRVRDHLMKKAGVPLVRLHDLRHLHASVAIHSGMDAKVLADRLGHSRASFTLDRYTHLFESQRAKSAVDLTGWLNPRGSDPSKAN